MTTVTIWIRRMESTLHDPRMMEYMGAPESARLLGRSPGILAGTHGPGPGGVSGAPVTPRC